MDFLKEKNYKQAYLWTTNEQTSAAALYVRYGFELTEEKESDAFGKPLMEQRFDLQLKDYESSSSRKICVNFRALATESGRRAERSGNKAR